MTMPDVWPAAAPSSGAAKATRPQKRSGKRRAEILDAAMSVFAERGYANGSLAEIAERAGMTHAGVLHHFGSKEQLLIALLEYRDEADVSTLEGRHAPEGAELLEHLIRTVERNEQRPGIIQAYSVLLGESVTDTHPARAFFTSRFEGLRTMVTTALAEATGRDPGESDIRAAANGIIGAMDGLQEQWLLDKQSVDMGAATRLLIRAVTEELRASPPDGRA